jgi:hypothetical protein
MGKRSASFEIESRSDARIVSRALDELHNRFREEGLAVRDGKADRSDTVAEFESLQDAVDADSRGTLIVTYTDEGPDDSP